MADVLPFDEIFPGATVRFTVIAGIQYLSIRDEIMHICGKTNKDACDVWRELPEHYKTEVSDDVRNFQFPGRGQSLQPVITFPGAVRLAMFLPGEKAKRNRSLMCKILVRYFAGDPSLITEIEANAASSGAVPQMARATLAYENFENMNSLTDGERRLAFDTEIRKRRTDIKEKELQNLEAFGNFMSRLNPDWIRDTRLKLQIEDYTKNVMFGTSLLIGNGQGMASTSSPPVLQSISLSQVAQEKGLRLKHGEMTVLGKRIAAAYRDQYGEPPSKHRQWVDGAERMVNSYTEKDRPIMDKVVNQWIDERRSESGSDF